METDHATPAEVQEEARRARKVRQIVDISTALIEQGNLTREEADAVVAIAREQILALFPDGEQTFEVIYSLRFSRLIREYAVPDRVTRGILLPFRPRRQ